MKDSEWKDAKKEFPPYEKEVLCYYEIERTGKDKKEPPFQCYIVASLSAIREGKGFKNGEWTDKDHEYINPTHWTELPSPPVKK